LHVTLTGVSRHFGAHAVLDDITLTMAPGSRLGIVGPNGAGKTTLLRILTGIDEPDTGSVTRAGLAGYLPQEADAVPGETLLETLARRTGVAAAVRRPSGQLHEPPEVDLGLRIDVGAGDPALRVDPVVAAPALDFEGAAGVGVDRVAEAEDRIRALPR